ncbi:MAG: sugar transporter [Proteobacteria bacterium]|nr:MAG: sugar transporter [Pseudomonadota bacterium]
MAKQWRLRAACFFLAGLMLLVSGCAHRGGGPAARVAAPVDGGGVATAAQIQPEPSEDYIIGAGDILEISVWKDAALSRQVVVLTDGSFNFPLLGRFTAAGKTVEQLESEMEALLIDFIPDPNLSVIVQQPNSQVIYVIGKVNRPGNIPLNRHLDVLQALSVAGGLNIFADKEDIRIFRKTGGRTEVIHFNYRAVTEENRLTDNIRLQRGDVIVVE